MAKRKKRSKGSALDGRLMGMVLILGLILAAINGLTNNDSDSTSAPTTVRQSISTSAPRATSRPRNTNTPRATNTPRPIIRYAISNANLRTCPKTDNAECPVIGGVAAGERLTLIESVAGETYQGNSLWYLGEEDGEEFYIHASLLSLSNPNTARTTDNTTNQVQSTIPPNTSSPPTEPPASASCPSMSATCSQLTCAQAYACLAAGHSRLDADKDGVPCESICPGG